jgi:hypothetical protein
MADAAGRKAVTVFREDLFRQVWTIPMSRLAQDSGISGNGVAKVCDRLKVPYPLRGKLSQEGCGITILASAGASVGQADVVCPT